ncbi:hypothetical protein MSLAZ_1231 [Methanosarcina lacustris Z-7289]|uniref:Uncharacterized protein n=1 Tax=Methanosarcina lacustris Z-7289 TaxID=1434111 RepID=A0A0E3S5I4_9EURY|nr:hypothetical protein MSLAZ_1231 [Methanosarcina lacustris Z-7289]
MKNSLFQVSSFFLLFKSLLSSFRSLFFLLLLSLFNGPPGKLAEASYYLWIEKRFSDSKGIFLSSGRGLIVFDLTLYECRFISYLFYCRRLATARRGAEEKTG